MAGKRGNAKNKSNGADIGFEQQLWQMADTLRGSMDAAEYKHVVLGLVFLKYISDSFEALHAKLEATQETEFTDPEDIDEYRSNNVFWVPVEARWSHLQKNARQPTVGTLVDEAMDAIEKANEGLKGVLPKDYARPALGKQALGDLIDRISRIDIGGETGRGKDVIGRVFEYFLGQFASAEGKRGGEFYTPNSIVRLLVEMLEPYKGRVFDPCCGSGGMFVQSERFLKAREGRIGDIAIYGQEMNFTTWRLAKMNLAVHNIDADLRWNGEGSFHKDEFRDLRAEFILANPPFNISDWGGERLREDARWRFGTPPAGNANFAWLQHILHHLSPHGTAGVVLANGSMSSQQSGEGDIRKAMIEVDVVDCMVALPGQLFYSTQIPACLWFLARDKNANGHRDRRGEILFIDARKQGHMVDRVRRAFDDDDIEKITGTYHRWRTKGAHEGLYEDVPGFCRSVTLEEVREHGHVLTPGRYVGAADTEDDGVPFEEKFAELREELFSHMSDGDRLNRQIRELFAKVAST